MSSKSIIKSRLFIICVTFALTGLIAAAGCRDKNRGATVEKVEETPSQYYGKEVTLRGEVQRFHGDRAFVLEGMGVWDDILVLTKTPLFAPNMQWLKEDMDVRVTGTVRRFVAADVERELGWDLDPQLETQYRDRPVLVASSITVLHEAGRWQENTGYSATGEPQAGAGDEEGTPQGEQEGEVVAISVITTAAKPEELAGKQVKLENVPVHQVVDEKRFWAGETADERVLVVVQDKVQVSAGQRVNITGTIHQLPERSKLESEWKVNRQTAEALGKQKLYIEANSVQAQQAGS